MIPNIVLYVNIYKDIRADRQKEIQFCLLKNVANPLIDTVVVICNASDRAYVDSISKSKKIKHYHYSHKPTFNEYFSWCEPDAINIIANADIFLNETLDKVKTFDWQNNAKPFFALSRWDIEFKFNREIYQHNNMADSQDTWMFYGRPSTIEGADFPLGMPGTDNRIAYLMHSAGYSVQNPSKTIQTIHYHHSKSRTYLNNADLKVPPPYLNVVPDELVINKRQPPNYSTKSRVMVPHHYECKAVMWVKNRTAPTEWNLVDIKSVQCDSEGLDANIERDGYSQKWFEMNCGDIDCPSVKRVSAIAMSIL